MDRNSQIKNTNLYSTTISLKRSRSPRIFKRYSTVFFVVVVVFCHIKERTPFVQFHSEGMGIFRGLVVKLYLEKKKKKI